MNSNENEGKPPSPPQPDPKPNSVDSPASAARHENPPATRPPSLLSSFAASLAGPLSAADLALFAEMLGGLVRANLPLPQALRMVGQDTAGRRLRDALQRVEQDVAAGVPLGEAMRRCPGRFPELFTRLVEQGSVANDLHAALVELVREYRAQLRFRAALWSQLMSPVATALVIGTLIMAFSIWSLPERFVQYYSTLRIDLPYHTRFVLWAGMKLHEPEVLAVLASTGAALILVLILLVRLRRSRAWFQHVSLKLPVLGPYLRTAMLGRFCRLMSILLHRGIPLNLTLSLVRETISFAPMSHAVDQVARRVEQGTPLHEALNANALFPPTLSSFVAGAQAHGDLPQTLSRLAELYEERGDLQGERLRFMLYLFAQVSVGLLVFLLLMSFYSPFYGISGALRRQ